MPRIQSSQSLTSATLAILKLALLEHRGVTPPHLDLRRKTVVNSWAQVSNLLMFTLNDHAPKDLWVASMVLDEYFVHEGDWAKMYHNYKRNCVDLAATAGIDYSSDRATIEELRHIMRYVTAHLTEEQCNLILLEAGKD